MSTRKILASAGLLALAMTLLAVPASAQIECIAQNLGQSLSSMRVIDNQGVVHDGACWQPATGIISFPLSPSGGFIITATGIPAPSPLAGAVCPTGQGVFAYLRKSDGTFQDIGSLDATTSGPPTAPAGTLNWCWRTWWNDSGGAMLGKNRLVSIYHIAGQGGVDSAAGTLDESAFASFMYNTGTEQSFHQFLTNYSEAIISGTPTWTGHATGEVSAAVYRGNLTFNGGAWTGGNKFYTFAAEMDHKDASTPSGHVGTYQSFVLAAGSGNQAASFFSGYNCDSNGGSGTETNLKYACLRVVAPSTRFVSTNTGVLVSDFGSNANDHNIISSASNSEQGKNRFEGKTLLNHIQTTGPNGSVAAPTCASTGTGGAGVACTLDTGSNDSFGVMTITAGAAPAALGTVTLTFNATYGTNGTVCLMQGSNAGTGAWNARVSFIAGAMTNASAIYNWDNNAVAIIAASTYKIIYHCASR